MGGGRGLIVHIQADRRRQRVYAAGRMEDGSSFAIVDRAWRPSFYIPAADADKARSILKARRAPSGLMDSPMRTMDGRPCARVLSSLAGMGEEAGLLAAAGIEVFEADLRPREAWLLDRGIASTALIQGEPRPGKRVDAVYLDPELSPAEADISLRWLSIDIETARDGSIRAIALAAGPEEADTEILFLGPSLPDPRVASFSAEAELLLAFAARLRAIDPDILTGWNVIEFDFRLIARRFSALGLPLDIGRSEEEARYLEGSGGASSALVVSGRQCLDAMRALRSGPDKYEDLSLETVARAVLGEGKLVHARGREKLEELDRLYAESPGDFAAYCGRDAALVLGILRETGLDELTLKRASLTGVGIDRAWTSIPPFEAIYARGLRARSVCVPPKPPYNDAGSPGGLILEPEPGLFRDVLVLDFKSLYPTLILTFNIDPLALEEARSSRRSGGSAADLIEAPNGARFSRQPGILPEAIADYFARREEARGRGDAIAVYVYKILMNSFYGVQGSPSCRYARTELAAAVTSFGQKWLAFTRDWAEARGYRVLYGDTDSVFIAAGGRASAAAAVDAAAEAQAGYAASGAPGLAALGARLCAGLNADIARAVRVEYGLESRLEIKLEKCYDRFLIPRMRSPQAAREESDEGPRGRSKGYAGRLADSGRIEIKGMEAARSDWTALARRFQTELLERVFADQDEASLRAFVDAFTRAVLKGELDDELVFSRILRRSPDQYLKVEPPIVRAARLLGWTSQRGRVRYLMTKDGAQPLEAQSSPVDREWYLGHQILPILRTIADTTGLALAPREPDGPQAELDFGESPAL